MGKGPGAPLVNCRRTITTLLECGDLSPLWPWASEGKRRRVAALHIALVIVRLLRIPRQKLTRTSNCTLSCRSRRGVRGHRLRLETASKLQETKVGVGSATR